MRVSRPCVQQAPVTSTYLSRSAVLSEAIFAVGSLPSFEGTTRRCILFLVTWTESCDLSTKICSAVEAGSLSVSIAKSSRYSESISSLQGPIRPLCKRARAVGQLPPLQRPGVVQLTSTRTLCKCLRGASKAAPYARRRQ